MTTPRRTLFLGLSKRSTGEATYAVRQLLKLGYRDEERPILSVHGHLRDVVASYGSGVALHELSDRPFNEILSSLRLLPRSYEKIVMIDLNAFFMEVGLNIAQRDELFALFDEWRSDGARVGCIDYFGTFGLDQTEYDERLKTARAGLAEKVRGIPMRSRLGYYLNRFVPERMRLQLHVRRAGISVFRPVPLNRRACEREILSYVNEFPGPRARSRGDAADHVLIGLSRFFEYTVDHVTIRKLCQRIIEGLTACLPLRSLTLIDPFECTAGLGGELSVKCMRWVDRETLDSLIDSSLFVGLFVPYGTVGSISLSRGTPFVSFVSSRSTADSVAFSRLTDGVVLPGFNALGVWEDEVFLPSLERDNPYFNAVWKVDLSEPDAFPALAEFLGSDESHSRIAAHRSYLASIQELSLRRCLEESFAP